jgi:hypothetical protein
MTMSKRRVPLSPRVTRHAAVAWQIGDIKSLRPEWSDEQCVEFMRENAKHIQDAMVQAGCTAIESLLPPKN